jgi:head-tail adaptor
MPNNPLFIDAGSLRHQITILAQNPAACDAAGQPIPGDWTTVLTTRASIRAANSREQVSDGQVTAQTTQIITIRWPGSDVRIVSGQRVTFGNDTYLVQGVDNVLHRNRVLRLTCLEINGDSL